MLDYPGPGAREPAVWPASSPAAHRPALAAPICQPPCPHCDCLSRVAGRVPAGWTRMARMTQGCPAAYSGHGARHAGCPAVSTASPCPARLRRESCAAATPDAGSAARLARGVHHAHKPLTQRRAAMAARLRHGSAAKCGHTQDAALLQPDRRVCGTRPPCAALHGDDAA